MGKSFWQLFLEWQELRKDKPWEKKEKEKIERQLAGYLIDTLELRQELIMACEIVPANEPLKELLIKRLGNIQEFDEKPHRTFDNEGGNEFYDLS